MPDRDQNQAPAQGAQTGSYPEPEEGMTMVGRTRLAQSLMLEEQGPGGSSRFLAIIIIFIVCAFLFWSTQTRISEVVVSSGEVSPVGSIKRIQHLEGGIVSEIKVAEGDLVNADQILVVLGSSTTQPELQQMSTRLAGLQLEAQQLTAVMNGEITSPENQVDPRHRQMATTQLRVFRAKLSA